MKILLLAALPEEADAFLPGVGETRATGWLSVRRLEALGHDIAIATTGIGKVNMASVAAHLQAHLSADLLAVTGTAGKIGTLAGDCFFLARAIQHDYGAERPGRFAHYDAGTVPIGTAELVPFTGIADPGTGLPHALIASGDAFIECPNQARLLVEGLAADIVDMETGALAQFAARLGLPWTGIKATTDDANHDSAGDFRTNLLLASKRAAEAMEGLLTRL
jgi:adenosylhomocysteine nucleosidase